MDLRFFFYTAVHVLCLNPHTESHYDQFHAALVNKEPKHLDILLCYEQSTACVGVKRTSFEVGHGYMMKHININVHLIRLNSSCEN